MGQHPLYQPNRPENPASGSFSPLSIVTLFIYLTFTVQKKGFFYLPLGYPEYERHATFLSVTFVYFENVVHFIFAQLPHATNNPFQMLCAMRLPSLFISF